VQEPDRGLADNLSKDSRPTDGAATLKERRPALDSLWRGTISSLWQTDRRCLRENTSTTNVHRSERCRKEVEFRQW